MTKILFLGGSYSQLPAIKYAKQKGIQIILVDYLPNNPGRQFADTYYNESTTDIETVLKIAKKEKINAVSAYGSDPAALTAAIVSEQLGLIGNSKKSVEILSDKNKFRQFLSSNHYPVPAFFASRNIEELLSFYKKQSSQNKTIFILKPVDSSGSKGVYIIKNEEDIKIFFPKAMEYSRNKKVILEEFIEINTPQIHGEAFVENGNVKFLKAGDQYFDRNTGLIPFSTTIPTQFHADYQREIFDLVQNVITDVGFKYGGINFEIRRRKNQLFLLEIGPRSGGNFMPQLIFHSTGFDLVKANVEILFGQSISYTLKEDDYQYVQLILHSSKEGILKKIKIPSFIEILEQHLYYKIGEKIPKYRNSRDVIGVIIGRFKQKNIMPYHQILYNEINVETI